MGQRRIPERCGGGAGEEMFGKDDSIMKIINIRNALGIALGAIIVISIMVLTDWLWGNIQSFHDMVRMIGIYAFYLSLLLVMLIGIPYLIIWIDALTKKRVAEKGEIGKKRFWLLFWGISIPVGLLLIAIMLFFGSKGTSFRQFGISILEAIIMFVATGFVVMLPILAVINLPKLKNRFKK
jgi:hypothetical protein